MLTYHMSAFIDGEEWKTLMPVTTLENERIFIVGTSAAGKILEITIDGDQAGTYNLSAQPLETKCNAIYKASATANMDDTYISTSGTVTIDNIDDSNKKLSGTFSFTLRKDVSVETVQITGGIFNNIKYLSR